MKLGTVTSPERSHLVAISDDGSLLDVGALLDNPALDMTGLIEHADALVPRLRAALKSPAASAARLRPGSIRWEPPVPRPSKIVGVALNNSVFEWLSWRKMADPAYFLKPPSALVGHGQAVEVDTSYGLTHPEPELAAVIGKRLRRADRSEVLAAVFGYTIINDITSPGLKSQDSVELVLPEQLNTGEDWRRTHGEADHSIYLTYHARSKGSDTFAPTGPWLVTADAIADPNNLTVGGYLDGDLVLQDSTANLTHSVQDVLSHLSHSMTLMPGDIVHFGTAASPTMPDRYPTLRSLDITRLGASISVQIEGIGRLDNPIVRRELSEDGDTPR